jgi:hypothetical protein
MLNKSQEQSLGPIRYQADDLDVHESFEFDGVEVRWLAGDEARGIFDAYFQIKPVCDQFALLAA